MKEKFELKLSDEKIKEYLEKGFTIQIPILERAGWKIDIKRNNFIGKYAYIHDSRRNPKPVFGHDAEYYARMTDDVARTEYEAYVFFDKKLVEIVAVQRKLEAPYHEENINQNW